MIHPKFFPVVLIALQIAACLVYSCHGDWRRMTYWIAGAVITAAVTF